MYQNNPVPPKVGLGCGTLIAIALIVLIFGNAGNQEEELIKLNRKLDSIESSMKNLERELSQIKRKLDNHDKK